MDLILRALDIQVAASRNEDRIEGSVPAVVPQEVDLVSRAERNCTGRAEGNCTTERRGVRVKVLWYVRA